jgi:hypothetical protein
MIVHKFRPAVLTRHDRPHATDAMPLHRSPALLVFVVLCSFAAAVQAQPPSITGLAPLAVRPGEAVDLKVQGANLAGAAMLWTSFPCETSLAPGIEGNGANNAEVTWRVTAPEALPVGVHGVRVVTPRGVSPLRLIVVDDLPSVPQSADNKTAETPQPLEPPVAVDGRMGNLERHYYRFQAAAGQRVSFEVLARRIGSALDPMIRLLDAAGRELAYCDDVVGLTGDAQLSHTFAESGQYVLELRDIRYQGGDNHHYRLRIGDFPCITVPYPMAARRGSEVALTFAGIDVEAIEPVHLLLPSDPQLDWLTLGARRLGGQSSALALLSLSSGSEFVETEPNDAAENANRVELGAGLNGRFETPNDADRYTFSAKKGDAFTFKAITRRVGSPADLYMQLFDSAGKRLAEADDEGTDDGKLEVTFPADGEFTLVVEDLHQRGGSPFAYRIAVSPKQPGFQLAAGAESLNVAAGGTAMVTVNAARENYNGPIQVAAMGLADGMTSVPTVIGPGMNSAVLTITAIPEAKPGTAADVRIAGTARIGDRDVQPTASVAEPLRGALGGMPFPPPHLSGSVAVAVAPEAGIRLRVEPPEITIEKTKSASVKVTVERRPEFDEAIALAMTPEKDGLPKGVTVAVKPIEKGKNEIEIVFAADDKAAAGEYTAVLVGTHKKGDATVTQPAPGIKLTVK